MNEERMIDVLAEIEKGRSDLTLDQSCWIAEDPECGTTACLAGWTVQLAGRVPVYQLGVKGSNYASHCKDPATGETELIISAARELLGLTGPETTELFMMTEDLSSIYKAAARRMGVDRMVLRDKVRDRVAQIS